MADPQAIDEARKRYIAERASYSKLAARVGGRLKRQYARERIPCKVLYRAKEVSSFVKKALARPEYTDPWRQITDKAGVRIIFPHQIALDNGLEVVARLYKGADIDDERNMSGRENRLEYPKVHAQVSVGRGSRARTCEVQLRTEAQDLWSKMSHALLYKPRQQITSEVKRSLYRLLALVELYDAEIERGTRAMIANPGYREAQLLQQAADTFHSFVAADYRLELSEEIIPVLAKVITESSNEYEDTILEFSRQREEKLREIYTDYGPRSHAAKEGRYVLAGQPESLLIFQLIESRPSMLREIWDQDLPADWLTELAGIWGKDL